MLCAYKSQERDCFLFFSGREYRDMFGFDPSDRVAPTTKIHCPIAIREGSVLVLMCHLTEGKRAKLQ